MKRGCRKNGKFLQLVSEIEKLDKKFRGLGMVLATGTLEGLWYETSDSGSQQDGVWRKHTAFTIGLQTGWPSDWAEQICKLLLKCGFMDESGTELRVHDWLDHAPRFVQDSVRKRRTRGGQTADKRRTNGGQTDSNGTEGGGDSGQAEEKTRDGCACLSLSLSQGLSQGLSLSLDGEGGRLVELAFKELSETGKFPGLKMEVVALGLRCVEGHPGWEKHALEAIVDLTTEAKGTAGVIGSAVPWIGRRLTAILGQLSGENSVTQGLRYGKTEKRKTVGEMAPGTCPAVDGYKEMKMDGEG